MAGQPDAADDLIAELAKLMAQDAQGDRKQEPAAKAESLAQFSAVRIPGEPARKPSANPASDLVRTFANADDKPEEPVARQDGPAAPGPAAPSEVRVPQQAEAEPFHFDFGFGGDSDRAPAAPNPGQGREAPVVSSQTAAPAPQQDDHDSIADLISASLEDDSTPMQEPSPAVPPQVPPQTRPAPSAGPALMNPATTRNNAEQAPEGFSAPRSDRDQFKVPPVFGLGASVTRPEATTVRPQAETPVVQSEPAAPSVLPPAQSSAPAGEIDPIDEIENLIGRAMRVELDIPTDAAAVAVQDPAPEPVPAPVQPAAKPPASPALRSLATPTVPSNTSGGLSAADQTIMAAAEASGAKVGWVNEADHVAAIAEEEPYEAAPRQRRGFPFGMSRALAGPLVAITLLLAAGFGLYWVLGLGSRDAGPAPLLTADTTPVKEVAPAEPADENANAQSVVFSEMDGATPATDEQLLPRDQSDVNEVTQIANASTALGEEGLANRKVRTVKVRPDGTIVSGDDGVAGSAILPVDRPNVPAVPGAESAATEVLASTAPTQTPQETATTAPVTVTPVAPGETVPAVDLAGNPIAGKSTTIPLERPSDLRQSVATQAAVESPTAPAAAATSPAIAGATEVPALSNDAPAYVQLASQRSEAEARQSAQNMVTRYGPLFGGANLEVQRVDLGAKGIYYRVRVPASSLEQANMICTNVKAAGGDCFTM